jgi:hydroxypyruvate isomerase
MSTIDRRTFVAGGLAAVIAAPQEDDPAKRLKRIGYAQDPDPSAIEKPGRTKHLKYAVNIEMWRFGTDDHVERIRRAAALGFSAVEMWPWRGKDLDQIARVCRETNVEVVQFTGPGWSPKLNDATQHDAVFGELEASCEAAHKLGTKMILVLAGNDVKGLTHAQMHQNVVDCLKRCVPICEKNDVTLILEPLNTRVDHKGYCLSTSADAIKICDAVASPRVKLCWDLYHMAIMEGDLCRHVEEAYKHIAYFQLADNPGRNDPGTGEVNYNRVMRAAWELGYRGAVGLEFTPIGSEHEAAVRVAAIDRW